MTTKYKIYEFENGLGRKWFQVKYRVFPFIWRWYNGFCREKEFPSQESAELLVKDLIKADAIAKACTTEKRKLLVKLP